MPAAHHVGVTVSNLERAVAFYEDVFGLSVVARFSVSGRAFATAVGVPDATGRFVHLDADGIRLELVEYDPDGEDAHTGSLNRPGATHLGLEVDDVDDFYRALSEDVTTVSAPQTTESGSTVCLVEDPEGNLIEVLTPSA
jgi:catechol 2,3-dioxygenase-like lactoylglutathione lyase family enzyme